MTYACLEYNNTCERLQEIIEKDEIKLVHISHTHVTNSVFYKTNMCTVKNVKRKHSVKK